MKPEKPEGLPAELGPAGRSSQLAGEERKYLVEEIVIELRKD